ncbi:MAG TPA: site-2 protease family protein [Bryobacteraceae bacterium]|nr:site-2 protease family protein [Bryobacteraceae bacterium]
MSSQDLYPAQLPYFGEGGDGQSFVIPAARSRERYWLYGLLFAATLLTTTIVGAGMQSDFQHGQPFDIERSYSQYLAYWQHPSLLLSGLPFSLTLLTILMAHEMGHYLAAMYHRVDASLPYFMPSPFLGTFGAFIRVRSPIYSKRVLFDIGAAGPLAGFVFLMPALSVGLAFSKVVPNIAHQGLMQFSTPGLQWLMDKMIFPGARTADICLHPVARAAWIGMFATALNLLPVGQLDGGHILYAFFPRRHKLVSKLVCIALLPLGWFWFGWLVWGLALLWVGRRHPSIYDDTDLTEGRRKLGLIALIVFALCFTWAPITAGGL